MSNLVARSLLGLGLLCAAACGGGSGGSSPAVSLHAGSSALSLTAPAGDARQARLVVTSTGRSGPVRVRATADGQGIERIEVSYLGDDALLDVRSSGALAPGVYTGTLTVTACADEACSRDLDVPPLHVAYTVTVVRALKVVPSPVELSTLSGATAQAAVAVTLPGDSSTFEASVTAGGGWLELVDRTAVGFTVRTSARPPGIYLGSVRVAAGDSALAVQVRLTVSGRPLVVTPTAVPLSAMSGAGAEAAIAVALPDGADAFTADPGASWLTVADQSAHGCTVRARSLPRGTYHATLSVAAGGFQVPVPIDYVVSAPPGGERGLSGAPSSLGFIAAEGTTAPASPLTITPPTWAPPLQTRVEYPGAAGWLTVTPTATGYAVQADAGALSQGGYSATLVVSGDDYTTDLRIPVAFTVGAGLVRPPDRTIIITSATSPADLSGSATVALAGGPERSWTATSSAAWLVLDRRAGVTGEALQYHVDLAHVAAMANGASQVATITISAAPAITPTWFLVAITQRLAQVTGVTPFAQPAGRANRFLVRGQGFGASGDPIPQLTIEGVGTVSATRRGPSELEVVVPAAPAGTYAVQVASQLGLPGASTPLRLFEPGALPYARFPQVGGKNGLAYDPIRRALYVVNIDQQIVLRFALGDGGWSQTQRSIAALRDLGLSADGSTLYAATTTGTLHLLDPDSLETVAAYAAPQPFSMGTFLAGLSAGLPETNDGRVWLAFGDYVPSLGYFDVATRTFAAADMGNVRNGMYGAPSFVVSRDGERLLINQSNYVTPSPPMLYLDAVDGVLHVSPATGVTFLQGAESDDGQRALLEGMVVYDGSFAPVGTISLPSSWYQRASTMSPDGRRAYVLAYSSDYRSPGTAPRVFVFDTTQVPASGPTLPLLGHLDVPDYASCLVDAYECDTHSSMIISPDERNLFIAGTAAVMVVPIPAALEP